MDKNRNPVEDLSLDSVRAILLARPGVAAELERIEREEMPALDAILKARRESGLTQAEVAMRMGTKASAVARLENAMVTGKHSPSLSTMRKYAEALGKQFKWELV